MFRFHTNILTFLSVLLSFSSYQSLNAQDNNKKYTRIVNAWNKAHNKWKIEDLRKLYAPKVFYYCKWLGKEECIENKTAQMGPTRIFTQKIISEIKVVSLAENLILCQFVKEVHKDNGVKDYPAYLVLKTIDDELRIICESDDIADRNMNFTLTQDLFTNPGKKPKTTKPEEKSDSGLGLPFYSITSISAIAIIAFAARRRRKRKALANSPQSSTTSAPTPPSEKKEPKQEEITNKEKGTIFENFIINKFDANYFRLLERTNDLTVNGISPEKRGNPDFVYHFELRGYVAQFSVECTFCSTVKDIIDVKAWDKLNRYKEFGRERQIDVYIILGLGGVPQNPKELFIIPLQKAKAKMSYDELKLYARSTVNRLFFDRDTGRLT